MAESGRKKWNFFFFNFKCTGATPARWGTAKNVMDYQTNK